MSKYTTEVRFICETYAGFTESQDANMVEEVIGLSMDKIFDFNFPIFDNEYKPVLERKILKRFYTREICEETVGLWKLRLNTRLNEIMPYYNKLYKSELLEFNPLYTNNLTRKRDTNGRVITTDKSTTNVQSQSGEETTGNGSNNSTSINLFSDTPQGSLTNVTNEEYLTDARKITDANTTTTSATVNGTIETKSDGTRNGQNDSTEDYLETVVGYEGINPSEMLLKYRETFLNIDKMILDNLEDLFIQLW